MPEPLVRLFRDYFNREWEVRAVPDRSGTQRSQVFENPAQSPGWLEFTADHERRRLEPLPPGWFVASDELLSRWCENAKVVAH
jgi:hypothetical protein